MKQIYDEEVSSLAKKYDHDLVAKFMPHLNTLKNAAYDASNANIPGEPEKVDDIKIDYKYILVTERKKESDSFWNFSIIWAWEFDFHYSQHQIISIPHMVQEIIKLLK